MEHAHAIIEELERDERGEMLADPQRVAKTLESLAIQFHVEEALVKTHGDTEKLMHTTLGDLTEVRPEQEEEARKIGTEELIEQLEQAEAGQEIHEPATLAYVLRLKAKEILEGGRKGNVEQGSLAA